MPYLKYVEEYRRLEHSETIVVKEHTEIRQLLNI